uniref:Uncharacterized protein n=1 Tax=Physcomitrium patens TaxID=3218 RepID=A0A2K1J2Q1_PHYPA|nr:hypothetical protein PHYPA_021657 [Physcomitrium patens]
MVRLLVHSKDSIHSKDIKYNKDKKYKDYFVDPSKWWDNKFRKVSPRAPDFKHKITKKGLWIVSSSPPEWVRTKFL